MISPGQDPLLTSILREVSRSFYLTLRVLPAAIRSQVSLAYLLARTTDTVADTEALPVSERLGALDQMRERILGRSEAPLDFSRFLTNPLAGAGEPPAGSPAPGAKPPGAASPAERVLLSRIEEALGLMARLEPQDRSLVRQVLETIISGQELDLRRFGNVPAGCLEALQTDADLHDYTYRVAGCVGEFWTRISRRHLFPGSRLDIDRFLADGVRFGQGLQMVNILRDLPRDLRMGRCYVPRESLSINGLRPENLLDPAHEKRFRPVYDRYLLLAGDHLAAGWRYTNDLPRSQLRLRFACAWPVLIGISTLKQLGERSVLGAMEPVKVSRKAVRKIIVRSIVRCVWPSAWERQFEPMSTAVKSVD